MIVRPHRARAILLAALFLAAGGALWAPLAGVPGGAQAAGEREITNAIGMRLALIPAGRFKMGSPAAEPERDTDEPQHEVAITRPFYLAVHEVTQEQFQKLMPKNPSYFSAANGGGPNHPVEQVWWREAAEFCKQLSELPEERQAGRVYRLPTEAEWEYACRAGTTTAFHFGNALSSRQANFNGNFPHRTAEKGPFLQKTAPVGSYPANAWGLFDMHGNVQEWCADWYDPRYYERSPKEDPKGPERGVVATGFEAESTDVGSTGFYLVVRGGSWLDEGRGCRSAYRFRFAPSDRYRLVGFRVAADAHP